MNQSFEKPDLSIQVVVNKPLWMYVDSLFENIDKLIMSILLGQLYIIYTIHRNNMGFLNLEHINYNILV